MNLQGVEVVPIANGVWAGWTFYRAEAEGWYGAKTPDGTVKVYTEETAASEALNLCRALLRNELRHEGQADLWKLVIGQARWDETMELATELEAAVA